MTLNTQLYCLQYHLHMGKDHRRRETVSVLKKLFLNGCEVNDVTNFLLSIACKQLATLREAKNNCYRFMMFSMSVTLNFLKHCIY